MQRRSDICLEVVSHPRPFDHIASSRKCLSTIFLEKGKFAVEIFLPFLDCFESFCAPCNPMIQSVLLIGTVAKFAKQNGWNGWFTPQTISIDCRKLQKTADADKVLCSGLFWDEGPQRYESCKANNQMHMFGTGCDIRAALSMRHGLAFLLSILKCNVETQDTFLIAAGAFRFAYASV